MHDIPSPKYFLRGGNVVAGFFFFIRGNGVLSWHCLLGERIVQKNDELDKPGQTEMSAGLIQLFFYQKGGAEFRVWPISGLLQKVYSG